MHVLVNLEGAKAWAFMSILLFMHVYHHCPRRAGPAMVPFFWCTSRGNIFQCHLKTTIVIDILRCSSTLSKIFVIMCALAGLTPKQNTYFVAFSFKLLSFGKASGELPQLHFWR